MLDYNESYSLILLAPKMLPYIIPRITPFTEFRLQIIMGFKGFRGRGKGLKRVANGVYYYLDFYILTPTPLTLKPELEH